MAKFNIITTYSEDREKYFSHCMLKMFDITTGGHDIEWYAVRNYNNCDGINLECTSRFDGKIVLRQLYCEINNFNKCIMLNYAIERMRDDFDYLIQWDCDLLATKYNLFDAIVNFNVDWLVLGGVKLTKRSTENIFNNIALVENKNEIDVKSVRENNEKKYVGNIAVTKKCYYSYLELMNKAQLYNEEFRGWGGEDSELSITSTYMANKKIITKNYMNDAWLHMWHERACEKKDFDLVQYNKNSSLLQECIKKNRRMIDTYVGLTGTVK